METCQQTSDHKANRLQSFFECFINEFDISSALEMDFVTLIFKVLFRIPFKGVLTKFCPDGSSISFFCVTGNLVLFRMSSKLCLRQHPFGEFLHYLIIISPNHPVVDWFGICFQHLHEKTSRASIK